MGKDAKLHAFFWFLGCLSALAVVLPAPSFGAPTPVQLVTDGDKVDCQEVYLRRELRIYKDPSLFLQYMNQWFIDPQTALRDLARETPLLTTVRGTVTLMKVGPPTGFKNFGAISKLYEAFEPRLRRKREATPDGKGMGFSGPTPIQSVMMCGEGYQNTMGFVVAGDLAEAQQEEGKPPALPPSVYPNPVPKLPPR